MAHYLAELNKTICLTLSESRRLFNGTVDSSLEMEKLLSKYRELYQAYGSEYEKYSILINGYEIVGGEKIREHLRYEGVVAQLAQLRGYRIPLTLKHSLFEQ